MIMQEDSNPSTDVDALAQEAPKSAAIEAAEASMTEKQLTKWARYEKYGPDKAQTMRAHTRVAHASKTLGTLDLTHERGPHANKAQKKQQKRDRLRTRLENASLQLRRLAKLSEEPSNA